MTLNDRLPIRRCTTFAHPRVTLAFGVFLLLASIPSLAQSATANYIKRYKPLAHILSGKYHIPTSVILGIAIVESGSGTGQAAKRLNNHFGMKGKNNLRKTHRIRSRYKQYPSTRASYIDFCEMVKRRKYYHSLKGVKAYQPWLRAISHAGYSTRPAEWLRKVTGVIVANKL